MVRETSMTANAGNVGVFARTLSFSDRLEFQNENSLALSRLCIQGTVNCTNVDLVLLFNYILLSR